MSGLKLTNCYVDVTLQQCSNTKCYPSTFIYLINLLKTTSQRHPNLNSLSVGLHLPKICFKVNFRWCSIPIDTSGWDCIHYKQKLKRQQLWQGVRQSSLFQKLGLEMLLLKVTWYMEVIISQIVQDNSCFFRMISFSHVKRNDNVVAHALVKEAKASNELQVWREEVSNQLLMST